MFGIKLSHSSVTPAQPELFVAVALCVVWASPAFAQNSNADNGDGQWGLGLGVAAIERAYRDSDREMLPLPIVSYENKWVSVGVPISDFKVWPGDSLSFRVRARFAPEGYEAKDSPFLAGMEERKLSVWVGGAVLWKTDLVNLSGEVLADAMGNSKGTRARAQIERRFTFGTLGFTPRLAAEWVDDKYVDYYYGVRQSEVRAGRPFYEGKSTTNLQVGLRVDYTPAPQHMLFLDVGVAPMGSSVKDSPIVEKSSQTSLALGYFYRF